MSWTKKVWEVMREKQCTEEQAYQEVLKQKNKTNELQRNGRNKPKLIKKIMDKS